MSAFALLFVCSCATTKESKRFPEERAYPVPDMKKPPEKPEVNVPKRKASAQLVEKGIAAMNADDGEKAEQYFHEAINVDTTNGVAYFYLAKMLFENERSDEALGFLDKAESLVEEDDEYWHEQIEELRKRMTGQETSDESGEDEHYY